MIEEEILYKIITITIFVTFYGCYFLKMIRQKNKGIKTDQIGKGKVGVVKFIEVTMKIATFLVPIAEVLSIFLLTEFPHFILRIIGITFGLFGDIIFIISVITMKDSWRAGVPSNDKTKLVTKGIYKISRNPAFLGFDILYIGILLVYFNWYLFAVSLFAIVMFHLQIVNVEEPYLISTFGNEYLEYKKHVNRYLGRR